MLKFKDYLNEMKIQYQKELNPLFWKNKKLDEGVEQKLLKIARDFFNGLELDTEIIDIQLTGSLANYNYTEYSDLDVHIIVNFKDINEDVELVRMAIDGERFKWNMQHDIVIRGHDVELFVQDLEDSAVASGLYSLLNHKWIKFPKYNPPDDVDTKNVDIKYNAISFDINELEKISKTELEPEEAEKYYKRAKDLKTKISKARREGLSKSGEFSIENLVFKRLRNERKIEKLIAVKTIFYDMIYSQ